MVKVAQVSRNNSRLALVAALSGLFGFLLILGHNQVFDGEYGRALDGLLATNEEETEEINTDDCYHIFIDLGANVGVHGRFLLEPEKYPEAENAQAIYEKTFGPVSTRDPRDFCVFNFEANKRHNDQIQPKAEAYEAMGWRYYLINRAVSDYTGTVTFRHNHDYGNEEWGFSVKKLKDGSFDETVNTIDFAGWLQKHIANRKVASQTFGQYPNGPKVVMKLDIEGSEYVVLPDLITSGALCESVDYMFGEFHPKFAPISFPKQIFPGDEQPNLHSFSISDRETAYAYGKSMRGIINQSRKCKTTMVEIDDESYLHDGQPLPEPEVDVRKVRAVKVVSKLHG